MIANKRLKTIYIWTISLTLFFHILNTVEIGGVKLFYIPSIISAILAIFILLKEGINKKLFLVVFLFLIVTYISAFLSSYINVLSSANSLCIIIIGCLGLTYCDKKQICRVNNIIIPIGLFMLIWAFLFSPLYNKYRFTGFYDDPNYLCTTLIIYLYLILIQLDYVSIKLKTILICELLILIFLFTITLSRTGIFCSIIILFSGVYKYLKNNKLGFLVIFVVLSLVIARTNYISYTDMLSERFFSNKDNVSSATNLREELSLQYLSIVINNPEYLFFGLGIGATGNAKQLNLPVRINYIRDHNTYTSCISEQGIIGLLLLLLIIYYCTKNIFFSTTRTLLRSITFCSLILFGASIWQMTYFPFWFGIFLLVNLNNRKYENNTYTPSR